MPSTNDFQPNTVWASSPATGVEEELTTPTGQTCRAKKMSIDAMIAAGILADTDALTAQVQKHTRKVKGGKQADGVKIDEKAIMQDTSAVQGMIKLMNKAMPHIVVSPVVRLHFTETTVGKTVVTKTIPVEDREPGVVYTDQIGFEDLAFIFDWAAGGLSALLAFRN